MAEQEQSYVRIEEEPLKQLVVELLKHYRVPENDAQIVSDVLVTADLRGIESHGVSRLLSYYISRLKTGYMKAEPAVKITANQGATFQVDADNGLGHPPSYRAMEKCLDLAEKYGVGLGSVKNSNHFGIAGYYSMMAIERGMIGICLSNAQPAILPTYARQKHLGTNPISVAAPAGDKLPFVLDMATSIVPLGKIQVSARKNISIAEGWGADHTGYTSTNPAAVLEGGGLYPLGGPAETAGYKGYGLAAVVDIFSGVLSGSGFLTSVLNPLKNDDPCQVGHFMAVVKINAFMEEEVFKNRMDAFIEELKTASKMEGQKEIFVAGEKEFYTWEENRQKGVPVLENVWEELTVLCRELNVSMPEPL